MTAAAGLQGGSTTREWMAYALGTLPGAALAVPDWPTTFGHNMFLFPWSGMVGGVFYEHSHRLIGAVVGALTLALAVALWRTGPPRSWPRVAGAGACHSDLHLQEFSAGALPYDLPFTLWHENSGWAEEACAGVTRPAKGDPGLGYGARGCRRRPPRPKGCESYCERSAQPHSSRGVSS